MDVLTKLFGGWEKKTPDGTTFQAFQAGLTTGAVSMRTRAMAAVDATQPPAAMPKLNEAKNKIGQLPDIPTEE